MKNTTIKGIKNLCSMTRVCDDGSLAVRFYYDIKCNKVFGKYFVGSNSYAIFDDPNIYEFGDTTTSMTQADILELLNVWKQNHKYLFQ